MNEHLYQTCLGTVHLTVHFVREAETRWPGMERWKQWNEDEQEFQWQCRPNWDGPVRGHMDAYVLRHGAEVVNSLAEIGL